MVVAMTLDRPAKTKMAPEEDDDEELGVGEGTVVVLNAEKVERRASSGDDFSASNAVNWMAP
jgi:hypothetical protein